MSQPPSPDDSSPRSAAQDERTSLRQRSERRENRSKNTLLWRELALIAALGLMILAFKFDWGHPEGDRVVEARPHDEIRLRDVRVTPPEPATPQPQPEQAAPPKAPKNVPPKEVPDEQVQDAPLPDVDIAPPAPQAQAAPAPQPHLQSPPSAPPADQIFSEGTAERNAQMKGGPLSPRYPARARRAGIQGRVILQFIVDKQGRPQDIEVLRSPNDMLSEAAVEALRDRRFTPARQGGQPVKMRMSQPVSFRIQ